MELRFFKASLKKAQDGIEMNDDMVAKLIVTDNGGN